MRSKIIFLSVILLFIQPCCQAAWPDDAQWNIVMKDGLPLIDPWGDANKAKDIVGNYTFPCCYFFNDGTSIFFRMRLDDSPIQAQEHLKAFGWGLEIDSNSNPGDYEWLIMVDGSGNSVNDETVTIQRNTVQGMIGDPGDHAEYINRTYSPSIGGYVNISSATGSQFGGDADYFISWYVPYNDFLTLTGLDNFNAIRVFFGSSSNTMSLTENGADMVGGTNMTLFSAASDWSTPMATVLTNGSINFVDPAFNEIAGSVITGNPVYIRVNDSDRNTDNLSNQTLDVILNSSNGDLITITLTETNISTGIFTGSVKTVESTAITSDQLVQVFSPGTINATNNDTTSQGQNVLRQSIIDVPDIISPIWDPAPGDQVNEFGTAFAYDVNATDNTAITYGINDTFNFSINTLTGLITNNTVLNTGNYYLNITATDTGLNSNYSSITITVQYMIPPETIPPITPPSLTNSTNATFTFNSMQGASYECSLDGGVYETCTSPKYYTGLPEGFHTFNVTYQWTIDILAAKIILVTTAYANGSFKEGEIIDINIIYTEPVDVNTTGGTPTLELNSGGSAVFTGGSGTSSLLFRYAVSAGENSPDLDYVNINSLSLNGGTIKESILLDANNTLPDVGMFAFAHDIIIDTTAPTVIINQAADQSDPTNKSSVNFTVIFNESVTGFTTGDVIVGGTANPILATVTGSGKTYNLEVTGMNVSGTVNATIPAGIANDTAGNANIPSTSQDNEITYDDTPPVITINGSNPITIELYSTYIDAGATASDNIDGDITGSIVTVNPVVNTTVGTYSVTFDVTDLSGNPASQVERTVYVNDTTSPVWYPAPSGQRTAFGKNFSYYVNAIDISTPISYGVNDSANFSIDENGIIRNKSALIIGTYGLNISASDKYGNTNFSAIIVTVQEYSKLFTLDADFNKGTFAGLEHDTVHDQLQLSNLSTAFPFIWVPNYDGTISKVDTVNGFELGRYKVAPSTLPYGGNPSRTTVDLLGNVWVGNRQAGTVVKVGLFEAGQCIDRNGNGIIESSQDTNGDGDITESEILPWGQDECVLYEVVLINGRQGTFIPNTYTGGYDMDYWGVSPRGLAIDANNNLWAGTWSTGKFYYINGTNGSIARTVDVSSYGHNSYGAVIDGKGILWSASYSGNHIMRLDPLIEPPAISKINLGHKAYGLGIDQLNHLFVSALTNNKLTRINISTSNIEWTNSITSLSARGVAVTNDNNVWLANSGSNTVTRYDNNGTLLATITGFSQPSGVAVDAGGKVWVTDIDSEYIRRINTSTNTVDLSRRITGSVGHYGYSDMTGFVVRGITSLTGTWNVVYDSVSAGTIWGRVSWNGYVPSGGSIEVRVKTAETETGLKVAAYQSVNNDNDFSAIGRYIQIETTLKANSEKESPILNDLRIDQAGTRIMGKVLDNFTQAGIPGIKVSTNTSISNVTDEYGYFLLNVPEGSYILTARFDPVYYANNTVIVNTSPEVDVMQDIELVRKPAGVITGKVKKFKA